MAILKSIRRNSKQLLESRRKPSIASTLDQTQTVEETLTELSLEKTTSHTNADAVTFFHLPAELRNVIYEDVALETKL